MTYTIYEASLSAVDEMERKFNQNPCRWLGPAPAVISGGGGQAVADLQGL